MAWKNSNSERTVERVCPRCSTVFESTSCPSCNWSAKDTKAERAHYCEECHATTRHFYKTRWLCIDCLHKAYANDYELKATPEQVARFLIKAGSKSVFWQRATEEQRQNAIKYFKEGKL